MKCYGLLTILIIAVAALGVSHCTFSGEDESVGVKLEIGAAAPPFSLPGSDGETHRLEDYVGKKAVVIAWFPKAFTGG